SQKNKSSTTPPEERPATQNEPRGERDQMTPSPIARTALDSLHAKLSAFEAGWLDGESSLDDYMSLLKTLRAGLVEPSVANPKQTRQTPLVNAGYAARLSSMTLALERWISYVVENSAGSNGHRPAINIVSVGCGLDPLSLWGVAALQRLVSLDENSQDRFHVAIYEFDTPENCRLKHHALSNSNLLDDISIDTSQVQEAKRPAFRGRVITDNNSVSVSYSLAALDLRKLDSFSSALTTSDVDTSHPTIVLSELVLAYVGKEGTNAVLKTVSTKLLAENKLSMFLCLEPLFPSDDASPEVITMQQGYSRDYNEKFLGKLQKGHLDLGESMSWLHSLGCNLHEVQNRLEECGFPPREVHCATLAKVSSHVATTHRVASTNFLRAKEPFDEHVALAMNLNCYCVVCAFSSSEVKDGRNDWKQNVCPWRIKRPHVEIGQISTLEEDRQVRELYSHIYVEYYNKYPVIRKMVKSALKMDLNIKTKGEGRGQSVIADTFRQKGGSFWVAKDRDSNVIGCIGIGLRKKRQTTAEVLTNRIAEYEVQRLAVSSRCRGNGIGRQLLCAIEDTVTKHEAGLKSSHSSTACTVDLRFWAITPEPLHAANKLYQSCRFKKVESFQSGKIRMNVYCKTTTI
ncbi:hypothetical protein THAOC_36990, partial [Thalassiosira oceanica]